MLDFSVNHMSLANGSYASLLACASELGCVGIEIRNDLDGELFDGVDAQQAGAAAKACGLRILALAEIAAFDDFSDERRDEVDVLIQLAADCNSEAISLIPRNDGTGCEPAVRRKNLRSSLAALQPMLEAQGIIGLIEPLGFERCSLRSKSEVVAAIDELRVGHCFKLVHDTFHHHLAGGPLFPKHTGIVHVSGVTDVSTASHLWADSHRALVDANDRLDSVAQLEALYKAGYRGPVSFEAFSTDVHQLPEPVVALRESISFIESSLSKVAA